MRFFAAAEAGIENKRTLKSKQRTVTIMLFLLIKTPNNVGDYGKTKTRLKITFPCLDWFFMGPKFFRYEQISLETAAAMQTIRSCPPFSFLLFQKAVHRWSALRHTKGSVFSTKPGTVAHPWHGSDYCHERCVSQELAAVFFQNFVKPGTRPASFCYFLHHTFFFGHDGMCLF